MQKLTIAAEGEDSYMAKVRGKHRVSGLKESICEIWKQAKDLLGDDQTFRFSEFEYHGAYYTATWDGVGYRIIFKNRKVEHTGVDVETMPNHQKYRQFYLEYSDNYGDDDISDEEEMMLDNFIKQMNRLKKQYSDNSPLYI